MEFNAGISFVDNIKVYLQFNGQISGEYNDVPRNISEEDLIKRIKEDEEIEKALLDINQKIKTIDIIQPNNENEKFANILVEQRS